MKYNDDVKGPTRFWEVKDPGGVLDSRLKLRHGDRLVFNGEGDGARESTITRVRSGEADVPWGQGCEFSTLPGIDGRVQGTHASSQPFTIDFTAGKDPAKATHAGSVDFPLVGATATWMADEGP